MVFDLVSGVVVSSDFVGPARLADVGSGGRDGLLVVVLLLLP